MPRFLRWSSFRLRTKGLIVVSLAVLPLACFWLIIAITYFRREPPTNTHTRSLVVQSGLARVFSALLDADAGARDNLLTDNRAALQRYHDAIDRLPATLAELNNAVIDPDLRNALETLYFLVDDELMVLRRLTEGPATSRVVLTERQALDRSMRTLNHVRELATKIDQRQSALGDEADLQRGQSEHVLFLTFLIGSVVCVGAGFVAAVAKSDGISRRIGRLARNADRLARGEEIAVATVGDDEITHLEARFREAAARLHEREEELRKSSEYQRHLNAALHMRTGELERANRELEAFSYSVSHDLRAPLRAIDGFSQVIEDDYRERLDEPGRDALQRVRAAAQRMGALIDDLLKLSRLNRMELRRERLDLGATAEDILADLARNAPARDVDVRIERDLVIEADPHMVRIALQNLLDNAWKYTGKTRRPRIEIGSSPNGTARVFHVRDNGAGFDMRYAAKLFGAFQRLHSPQEFDGTGVGLATVQRIVHRHGGRIWADSTVDAGATFYFTLEPEPEHTDCE
jgi:signal transduction histidine kinase